LSASLKNTHRNTRIRVGPQNIAQQSGIRDIARTINVGNLFHLRKLRTESSVHANDFVVNDSGARQTIEGVAKLLPHFDRVAASAFVVKAVNTIDTGALVVSAEEEKVFGVLDFVGKQEADNFQRLFPAIHVVSEEQVICLQVMKIK